MSSAGGDGRPSYHAHLFSAGYISGRFPAITPLGRAVFAAQNHRGSLADLVRDSDFVDKREKERDVEEEDGAMESALHQRDHIGVQDAVLLENYNSEDAFLENLQKRFRANLIYVSLFLYNLHS